MKVLSTDGLTKLIQLIKSSFIKTTDTVTTNEVTLATVATSGSYNDLTNKPTIDTAVSRTSTNAVQNKAIQNYIVSRGENLVTNGFATLGNNYNFNSFTFDGSDTYGAGGCFSYTSTAAGSRGSIISDEPMPVDITQSYKLSYAVKNTTSTSTYDYINMYDIDGYSIAKGNVDFVQGTTTTLAQDLKDGDTKVYLTNISSSWHTGQPGTTGANYYRSLIFWNYQNSYGYTYPVEYYSRNWWFDLWNNDNDVDAVNGIITLKSAWNHGTFPAGTSVSQGTTSGGYVYANANYIPTAGEWTEKSFIFTPDRFRNGTSYIRLGWLYNYSQRPSNVFKISSISLTQNLSIKDAMTSESYATSSKGGVVKVLSTYGTNINTGYVTTFKASDADIDAKTHQYRPIVPYNLDYAVKKGITSNTLTLTDAEKTAAQNWLGVTQTSGGGVDYTDEGTASSGDILATLKNTDNETLELAVDAPLGRTLYCWVPYVYDSVDQYWDISLNPNDRIYTATERVGNNSLLYDNTGKSLGQVVDAQDYPNRTVSWKIDESIHILPLYYPTAAGDPNIIDSGPYAYGQRWAEGDVTLTKMGIEQRLSEMDAGKYSKLDYARRLLIDNYANSVFIPPANGYIEIDVQTASNNGAAICLGTSFDRTKCIWEHAGGGYSAGQIRVNKGQFYWFNNDATINKAWFVPLKGAN